MATFSYNAINVDGLAFDGTLTAADVTTALGLLRQQGLMPDRLDGIEGSATSGKKASAGAFKAVKPKSLQIFSRQFATMIEAGLNVIGSLVILEQQTSDAVLASTIGQLR